MGPSSGNDYIHQAAARSWWTARFHQATASGDAAAQAVPRRSIPEAVC